MARPKIELDYTNWQEVEKLCGLQCTGDEIADFLDISYNTLVRRIKEQFGMSFEEYYKKHSSKGKRSLRRKQYEQAMNGNTTLLIWLGKQYLGQADKQEVDNKSSDGTMKPVFNIVGVKPDGKGES